MLYSNWAGRYMFRQPRRLFRPTILDFHERFFGTQLFLFLNQLLWRNWVPKNLP